MRFESVKCLRKTNNTDGPSVKVCAESHTGAHRSGILCGVRMRCCPSGRYRYARLATGTPRLFIVGDF